MKTWEALKAADEGKKIRRRWWAANMYSFRDESRFCNPALITHYGTLGKESLEDLIWDDIFADDWEIYEEVQIRENNQLAKKRNPKKPGNEYIQ